MKMIKVFAALVMALGLAAMAAAGNQEVMKPGTGGGQPLKDATNLNRIEEASERPVRWAIPVVFGCLSGTSGYSGVAGGNGGVTLTGASTNYVGPYYFAVNVTANAQAVHIINLTFVAGVGDSLSPTGEVTANTAGYKRIFGPYFGSTYMHMRGGLNLSGSGNYQIGWCE